MPWEKAFETEKVLDTAMQQFWQLGYQKASIAAISKAAGASRYGLYDEFGDKHSLYLHTLEHYQSRIVSTLLAPLEKPGAGLNELRTYRDRLLLALQDEQVSRGCLMCIAAIEMANTDAEVASCVEKHFKRQRNAFINCLACKTEPEALADMLLLAIQGASLLLRANTDLKIVKQGIEAVFDLLLATPTVEQ